MTMFNVAFVGDVVGAAGRRVFKRAAQDLRDIHDARFIIVNGENSKNGSGLTPEQYHELRESGADAVTLGDHWAKESKIFPTLIDPTEAIARPANLSLKAPGKTVTRVGSVETSGGAVSLHVITVLGRLYNTSMPANDPFECVDREVGRLAESDPGAMVIVEAHAEATSEKIALAWHCVKNWPNRVVAVVGSHTHVQTADARILDGKMAAMTDLGMCGSRRSVLGRDVDKVLQVMVQQRPVAMDVSDAEPQATGCVITLDAVERRATAIKAVCFTPPAA
ncbi:MAG: YmdB family metallophosphoesterase [Phycisphaerales bacterium]